MVRLPGMISAGEAVADKHAFSDIKENVYGYLDAWKAKDIEFTIVPRSTRCFAVINKTPVDGGCKILFEWGARADLNKLVIAVYADNNPRTENGRAFLKEVCGIKHELFADDFVDNGGEEAFFAKFREHADKIVETLLDKAYMD